jgi:hypothetical protein
MQCGRLTCIIVFYSNMYWCEFYSLLILSTDIKNFVNEKGLIVYCILCIVYCILPPSVYFYS